MRPPLVWECRGWSPTLTPQFPWKIKINQTFHLCVFSGENNSKTKGFKRGFLQVSWDRGRGRGDFFRDTPPPKKKMEGYPLTIGSYSWDGQVGAATRIQQVQKLHT